MRIIVATISAAAPHSARPPAAIEPFREIAVKGMGAAGRSKWLLPLSIAFSAIPVAKVAIANIGAAVHKDRAFQASSPKNFPAGRKTGLFFGRDFPYGTLVSSANTRTES
ncbi:hypothetical protein [uncultured Sphingomonas sp.]|uniref:hypothetical protein n=1 Tax=uncultured Sphingomonas sp. TaxID=158754 RepID=UPI0025E30DF7|nr:hypothetical protein [uncultured Sphingomonas sp.]